VAHWSNDRRPAARNRLALGAATVALAALTLSACGGSSGGSSAASTSSAAVTSSAAGGSSAASTVGADGTLTATEQDFSISIGTTTLKAGPYLIKVENQGNATHDLVVEKGGNRVAGTDSISPGSSGSLSVTLQPGNYVFYCSIGNHRAMGMETTIHVQ
jgi:plastocyanin